MGVNLHLWHRLSPGIGEFQIPKRKFWFEQVPGFAYKAVWLGRERKQWFCEKEYLVLYRCDVYNKKQCYITWVPVSQLYEREMSKSIDKDYICHDEELNGLFNTIINSSLKDAILNTNES